jgi:hypothetical protein
MVCVEGSTTSVASESNGAGGRWAGGLEAATDSALARLLDARRKQKDAAL